MNWKPLPNTIDLETLIDQLNRWNVDNDRRVKALLQSRSISSASNQIALTKELQVDSSRVMGLVSGSTGAGSTLTAGGAATQIQFNTSGLLDGDPELTWQTVAKHFGVTGSGQITGQLQVGGITAGLIVTGGLTASNGASITGHLVTTTLQTGGFSASADGIITGGLTVSGRVTAAGLSVNANSNFGAFGVSFAGSTLSPITTLTGALGVAARRWANLFGSTINVQQIICANTFSQTASGVTNTIGGNLRINGDVSILGTFSVQSGVIQDWLPAASEFSLGNDTARWGQLNITGPALLAKGGDLASGTTVFVQTLNGGNYYDITGANTIAGISSERFSDGVAVEGGLWTAGTPVILQFDSTPAITHNATRLVLRGGNTFHTQPGDHLVLIGNSSTANEWREVSRSVRANLGQLTYFTQVADKTIGSTTDETSLLTTGIGTTLLPTNFFGIGRTLRATAAGVYGVSSVLPGLGGFFAIYLGTTRVLSTNSGAGSTQTFDFTAAGELTVGWKLDSLITARTIGTAATLRGSGLADSEGFAAKGLTNAAVQIDTTQALPFDLRFGWGSTGGGVTITCTNFTLEALG